MRNNQVKNKHLLGAKRLFGSQCNLPLYFVKYLLKHASDLSHTPKYRHHTRASHKGCVRCIFNARAQGWSGCVSQADTLTLWRGKNFFTGSLRWSVAMATASLPLASASLSLPHSLTHSLSLYQPLSRGQSLILLLCISSANLLPLPLPLAAYLKLISLAANGGAPGRIPSARACLPSALGEMKTDSRWHRGRRDADALMCPPTPT